MYLPFWSSGFQFEVSSWFPWGRDYKPVSVNRAQSPALESIAASCLDMEGEFLFMAAPELGCVGNLPRDRFFSYTSENIFNLGFLMLFGYSEKLEKSLLFSMVAVKEAKGLQLGITACSIYKHGIFEGRMKVIALVSDEPFYDCTKYLEGLAVTLKMAKNALKSSDISYYAEKFGYDRFLMDWEDVNPYEIKINELISEFEEKSSQEIVGGSNKIDFPPFLGIAIGIR